MVNLNNTIYFLNREQEERHVQERAKKLNLPYIELSNYPLVKEVLDLIPENDAITYKIIPYLKIGREVRIGILDQIDDSQSKYLQEVSAKKQITFTPSIISQSSFYYGIAFYEQLHRKTAEINQKKEEDKNSFNQNNITDIKSAAEAARHASTTKLLETLLYGAIKLNASDIHLEPSEQDFVARFRIDGVLQDIVELPIIQHKQLLSRIKFLSKLRLDIIDKPQDGRFSFNDLNEQSLDFRVSIMPSAYGEAVVMRVLGQEKTILTLNSLGFRKDALTVIHDAIHKPHGMILTSGPTGSGKSSTLYAILVELKQPGIKIITLEDPVEYKIEGIEQSQIKPGQGYEFADGLRASLRQDPDILMVGEIRDAETAEIAVQSALTGHLLLSTIHANSAPAVFARLLEIGVKPFLLSGSINLIMAQRLVRKICPFCKEEYVPDQNVWANLLASLESVKNKLSPQLIARLNNQPKLFRGKGCEKCNGTGYTGRQIIVEILVPEETIEKLIGEKASISEFEKAAHMLGMVTMEQDGLTKALVGETTVEEVWRVTRS